jgi:hypothetical protein
MPGDAPLIEVQRRTMPAPLVMAVARPVEFIQQETI